jgi:hypothetical protein
MDDSCRMFVELGGAGAKKCTGFLRKKKISRSFGGRCFEIDGNAPNLPDIRQGRIEEAA